MKIIRFEPLAGGAPQWGWMDAAGRARLMSAGSIFGAWQPTDEPAPPHRLLAPVAPPVIFAIGLNYRDHAAESGAPAPRQPVVFMKSPLTVQDPGRPIVLPRVLRSDQVDYEAELAVVVGSSCKNVTPARALEYVAGFCCANDVTARDWQRQWGGGQFCRGKTFDTFCPLGPWLVTPDELPATLDVGVRSRVNGESRQNGRTAQMIFSVPELIAFLSGSTTLPAGAVILTGTPAGVGMGRTPPTWLQPGDQVEVEIDGLGVLRNPVIEESAP
jgi:2-keto-4-pentenoate hydratase/2-oxohepta-3-ene-1,7-dioic acid hydratase in catechol pathway